MGDLFTVKGGENIRLGSKLLLILLLFTVLLTPVCAQDVNSTDNSTLEISPVNNIEDAYVYDYFDMDNIMTEEFSNATYIITESLRDYGVLTIEAPNTVFRANEGVVLENIAFNVRAENVTIENITLVLTESFDDNDGSAIMVQSDNVTIQNIVLNYVAPKNTEAYGIHINGKKSNYVSATRLINNTIYFVGNNYGGNDNFGIWLYYTKDTLLDGNTLISSFPLRTVDHDSGLMISDAVAGVAVLNTENLNLTNNYIFVDVNRATLTADPTLDGIIIKNGKNILFANNTFEMEDFATAIGVPNYLYGLDIYNVDNMLVKSNNFSVKTQGGVYKAGTAYPIQLTGPLSNVTIDDNDIYSISNGPNLGIYSTNYGGSTSLKLVNNRINVTGLAGEDPYALVAGIEVQVDNGYIVNNTIAVSSIAPVGDNDNLYGISYRQKLEGEHTFVIKDNVVFSNSTVAVYLYDSVGSVITDNIVVSSKEGIPDSSYEGYKEGPGSHSGDTYYNNKVLSEYEYWVNYRHMNEVDGGENTTYVTPENVNNRTNNIDASDVFGKNDNPEFDNNPFYNGSSTNTDKPNVPTNPNDRNNDNTFSDDFNENAVNPGDEENDNPSGDNPGDRPRDNDDVNPGDRPRQHDDVNPGDRPRDQGDIVNHGDEPIENPSEPVENPGDEYVEDSGSNTNGNPGDQSTPNPYHYDETQHINGTRVDNGGVTEYNEGVSLSETKQNNVTSNTDSGSTNTNSYGGQNSILVNTTTDSPSNTGEDSAASSEKSSTSSNVESVGSENPASANSVSKAYEILDNIVKNPQSLVLPALLGFIALALLFVGYKRKSRKDDEY
ncbi:MAG: hypothetical protein J6P12_10335 [Methanobrevibacter sp.]|nr:hypothetical protein [Methanobrevibacter sp.]